LRRIRDAPPPAAAAAARALTSDLAAGVNLYSAHIQQRNEFARQARVVERVRAHPLAVRARQLRDRRWARVLSWPVRRLAPGALRRLLGP
jgi:hypothetical protein